MRESEMNSIQVSIMRQLFFHERRRFAQLNVDKVPSDQFSYHVRQLIKYGLVEKEPDGQYRLSVLGRSRAVMLYPDKDSFIEQGFLAARIVLMRHEAGVKQILIQERLTVPYQGSYGTPGDKVIFGEDVAEAGKRSMREQTGLDCAVELRGLAHFKDRHLGKIVQDKYFFIFHASYLGGRLIELSPKGNRNFWIDLEVLKASPRTMPGTLRAVEAAETGSLYMDEETFEFDTY